MKVYFHFSLDGFSNCYIVGNDATKEALIIDPGKMTPEMLNHIELNKYTLSGILITHNHTSHCRGLSTLMKIYSPKVYAADFEIAGTNTIALKGDGVLKAAGFAVGYLSVPGHSSDSMTYKIGRILFTGDALTAGLVGTTNNSYAEKTLRSNVQTKLLSQQEDLIIMPGHGPPSTVAAEKKYNLSVGCSPQGSYI